MTSEGRIRDKLKGYPAPVVEACLRFIEERRQEDLDTFVIGVLFFLMDIDDPDKRATLTDDTHLREGLGIESITIAELLFLVEDIFAVDIDDGDVAHVETLGDLKAFLRSTAQSMSEEA